MSLERQINATKNVFTVKDTLLSALYTLLSHPLKGTSKNQATSAAGWPVGMKTTAAARDDGCQQDCPDEKEAIFRGALNMGIPVITIFLDPLEPTFNSVNVGINVFTNLS